MKVNVNITVEIDLDAYRDAYGDEERATIAHDLRYAILTAITSGGILADGIESANLHPTQR